MHRTIIFLSTALIFSNVVYSFYLDKFALPEKTSEVEPQISPRLGYLHLRYYKDQAVIIRNQCNTQTALWMGSFIAHTDSLFQDAASPIFYDGIQQLVYGRVTSAQYINGPSLSIVFVIDGLPFVYSPSADSWIIAQGVTQYVTEVSVLQCCLETVDEKCKVFSHAVLLYDAASDVKYQRVYLSTNAGMTYSPYNLATDKWEFLIGAYITVSKIVALVADQNNVFYIRETETSSQVSESFPLQDSVESIEVIQVPGMRGHMIIWSPHMLLYSPNDGRVIVPVLEIGKDNSAVPPPGIAVWSVTAAGNGVIAVVTSDGGVYYGRLGLKAVTVKFSLNIINSMAFDMAMLFDEYWDLVMMKPLIDHAQYKVSFLLEPIGMQQQLTQTSFPVISCPVERFSGDFKGKVFYIDHGVSVKLTLVYVPTPLCPFFPVVISTSDIIQTEDVIVDDGVTPEGYKTFKMEVGITLPSTYVFEGEVLATISIDLMEREVSCNELNPQTAYIIIGCPPGKHIRVMRNHTACTRGRFTPEQLQDDFTYIISQEVYDPGLQFRPNMAVEDLEIVYSYMDYLCPLLVYYDMPWRPTLELWDGDTFLEVVKADFVMFEKYGMHNYKYLQTAKKAKCVSQPQDWISMLANQFIPNIYTAWTRSNYKSCKDYDGPPLTDPEAEYQVLNQDSRNKIVFDNYNGMYVFTATVVDPHYSFCSLRTTFSVYVYGAFPARVLPAVVPTAIFIGIFSMLLFAVYFLRDNTRKNA